ncbi:MAG: DUF255 domain-containing protein [Saprospiraceae bacterium]|nr:DUF255 domain-containing protein [Saprospiraceae bacterium]
MKKFIVLKHITFVIFMAFFISACNNETKSADVNEPNSKTHPAQIPSQSQQPKNPNAIKVDARGGTLGDQISQQQIAAERQKRLKHLNTGGLQWTTFDKIANEKGNKGNKKYMVDVYTEWCGWCKVMDKKTFTDPDIQAYLRENFHIVKFDAEQKEAVRFKDKEYNYVKGGRKGINKLAVELLGNRMSYPTLVYLDENLNKITASPGYKKPDQLMAELKAIVKK